MPQTISVPKQTSVPSSFCCPYPHPSFFSLPSLSVNTEIEHFQLITQSFLISKMSQKYQDHLSPAALGLEVATVSFLGRKTSTGSTSIVCTHAPDQDGAG